jgi:hypothetical protein
MVEFCIWSFGIPVTVDYRRIFNNKNPKSEKILPSAPANVAVRPFDLGLRKKKRLE